MKKLIGLMAFLLLFTVFGVWVLRTPSDVIYLLNWGEYIDQELVQQFEKEYNCQVIEETVTSSEAMYQKIISGTTRYDVAIPGDYCVRQLYKEGKLMKLDIENESLPNLNNYESIFVPKLKELMDSEMSKEGNDINQYYMPYFWGAYSMIYSTRKPSVEEVVLNNGFASLYDRSLYSSDVEIGMYNTARWIIASYLLGKEIDPNITNYDGRVLNDLSDEVKDDIIDALMKVNFDEFNDDALKRNVANGNLDLCFTQLGDFFDALYFAYEDGIDTSLFNCSVPNVTAAFFDSMVIPTTCANKQHYDLANKFINFMLEKENAYQNARAIGYSPTLNSVVDKFNEDALNPNEYYFEGKLTLNEFIVKYPMYLNPLYNSTKVYLLEPKSNDYLTSCETIYNQISLIK